MAGPGVLCWRPPGQRLRAQSGGRQQGRQPAGGPALPLGLPASTAAPDLHGDRDCSSTTGPRKAGPGSWPGQQSSPPGRPPRLGVKVQLLLGGAAPPPSGRPTPSCLQHRNKGLRALPLSPRCCGPIGGACARGVEAAIAGEVSSGQFGCQRLWVQGPVRRVHRPWAELRLQTWGLGLGGRSSENIVLWCHMDAKFSRGPGRAEPRSPGPAVPEGTPVGSTVPATAPGSTVATGTAASLTGPGARGRLSLGPDSWLPAQSPEACRLLAAWDRLLSLRCELCSGPRGLCGFSQEQGDAPLQLQPRCHARGFCKKQSWFWKQARHINTFSKFL